MKKFLWMAPVAVICAALLAGREDILRFRAMHRMSRDR
jgi:hypothetical protein